MMHADLVVFDGGPFHASSRVTAVLVDGSVFNRRGG